MTKARTCGQKARHASKADAERHLFALVRNTGTAPRGMSVYRCPHCGSWHVGHRKRRRR